MRFFTFVPFLLLGQLSLASPLDSSTTAIGDNVNKADGPISALPSSSDPIVDNDPVPFEATEITSGESTSNTLTKNIGFHTLAAARPDSYMICSGNDCSGHCVYWTLSQINSYTCYKTPFSYKSAYITRNSGAGLTPGIASTGSGCSQRWTLPRVNTCYNWNSARSGYRRG